MHHTPVKTREPRVRLLAIAAALAIGPGAVFAQASGATVVHGQASFAAQGNNLTITTVNGAGTRHSAINWQSFSVPQGGTTRFNQPDAASTSINRVLGNDPSRIFGTLSSNGRLVLVNPSGITVGSGAVVDTAGFTASTLRMSDADALAGRLRFEGNAGGALQVDGNVLARGGDVVLISSNATVGAGAVVRAPDGAVVLAAGQSVEITGRGLEGIRMEVIAPTDSAVNLGTLEGDAVGIFAGSLRHSGFISAAGAELDAGKLRLLGTYASQVDGVVRAGGLKLALATTLKEGKGKDGDKDADKADKDKADKDKADKEKADKEKADREKAEKDAKDKADKDKADKEARDASTRGQASGNSENGGAGNGSGSGSSGAPAAAPATDTATTPASTTSAQAPSSAPSPAPSPAPAPAPAPAPVQAAASTPAPAAAPAPASGNTVTVTQPGSAPVLQQAVLAAVPVSEVVAAVKEPQAQTVSFLADPVASVNTTTAETILTKRKKEAAAAEALQCQR